jgi:oligopeptide transport system ATP-binding protein
MFDAPKTDTKLVEANNLKMHQSYSGCSVAATRATSKPPMVCRSIFMKARHWSGNRLSTPAVAPFWLYDITGRTIKIDGIEIGYAAKKILRTKRPDHADGIPRPHR